jgi:hypothetical protein
MFKKSTYKIGIFILIGSITLILCGIATRVVAENSLSNKSITVQASNTELNNAVSKLQTNQLQTANFDATIITIESIEKIINSQAYTYPNILEKLWFSSKSQYVTSKINTSKEVNNTLLSNLASHRNNLVDLKQLINYSAVDDFSQLGIDPANDTERIARTEEGLTKLKSTIDDSELSMLLDKLLGSFSTFEADTNIQNWDKAVKDTQSTILLLLLSRQLDIVNKHNTAYNQLLYKQ